MPALAAATANVNGQSETPMSAEPAPANANISAADQAIAPYSPSPDQNRKCDAIDSRRLGAAVALSNAFAFDVAFDVSCVPSVSTVSSLCFFSSASGPPFVHSGVALRYDFW